MRTILLSISFLFSITFIIAQKPALVWSAQTGHGVNFAKKLQDNLYFPPSEDIKSTINYSYHYGINLYIPFHEKYGLRVGVHYNRFNAGIRSIRSLENNISIPEEFRNLNLKNDIKQSVQAIALPIVYESKIQGGSFRLGLQYTLLIKSKTSLYVEDYDFNNNQIRVYEANTPQDDYKESEVGFRVGYSYLLTPYLSLDFQSFIGILRLQGFERELYTKDGMNRQFTIGLSYYLVEKT